MKKTGPTTWGAPDTNLWFGNDTASGDVVLNIFYSGDKNCNFNATYIESQLLSTHMNLGSQLLESRNCRDASNKMGYLNNNLIQKVMHDCGRKQCSECGCRGIKEKACFGMLSRSVCPFIKLNIKVKYITFLCSHPQAHSQL